MARKGENIFKRKDGRFEARYAKGRDDKGRLIYGYLYGRSYLEVKEKRKNFLLNYGKENKCTDKTLFKVKAEEWLNKAKSIVKPTTYGYYQSTVSKHLLPYFGDYKIKDLNENIIYKYIDSLNNKDLKNSTIRQILVALKSILRFSKNIIDFKLPKDDKREIEVLTDEEANKLIKYCKNTINPYTIGILISLGTGIRLGEVCALRWESFDLDNSKLHIKETVSRISNDDNTGKLTKLVVNRAKTEYSIRDIHISKRLVKIIKKYKDSCTINNKSDFILTNSTKIMDPRTYYNNYKKILIKARIEDHTYHCLRHTFATKCCELGLNIKTLSKILGHSDIKITLNIYVHPSERETREFFEEKFSYS